MICVMAKTKKQHIPPVGNMVIGKSVLAQGFLMEWDEEDLMDRCEGVSVSRFSLAVRLCSEII
jgi:hypothetical protein